MDQKMNRCLWVFTPPRMGRTLQSADWWSKPLGFDPLKITDQSPADLVECQLAFHPIFALSQSYPYNSYSYVKHFLSVFMQVLRYYENISISFPHGERAGCDVMPSSSGSRPSQSNVAAPFFFCPAGTALLEKIPRDICQVSSQFLSSRDRCSTGTFLVFLLPTGFARIGWSNQTSGSSSEAAIESSLRSIKMEDTKYLPELLAEKDSLDSSFTHAMKLISAGKGFALSAGRGSQVLAPPLGVRPRRLQRAGCCRLAAGCGGPEPSVGGVDGSTRCRR